MILGSDRVGAFVTPVERETPVEPVATSGAGRIEEVDPLGLDALEQDEFVKPVVRHDDFQSLDEIFGTMNLEPSEGQQVEESAPFDASVSADKDASSTLMGNLGLDDEFQSALDVFDPPPSMSSQVSAPRIVRANSGSFHPSPQVVATDVFDPFAPMESQSPESAPREAEAVVEQGTDFESAFGALVDGSESIPEPDGTPLTSKIVRGPEFAMVADRSVDPPTISAEIPPTTPEMNRKILVPTNPKTNAYNVAPESEPMTEPRDQIYWKSKTPLVGFLVTYDFDPQGSYVELRQGRLMVSNQREDSGSCLVVAGESVSTMHAIMRVVPGGVIQVLDQLSEAGTRVRRIGQSEEDFLSGEKSSLSHGDIVFFGDRKFHVLLVVGDVDGE
jgi:hypothetical protein